MRDAPGLAAALAQMRRRGLDRGMDAQAVAAAERALQGEPIVNEIKLLHTLGDVCSSTHA